MQNKTDLSFAIPSEHSQKFAHRLAQLLCLLIAFWALWTYKEHGISNDEEVQHVYGRLLLDYYLSGFKDLSAFEYKNLYLYGGFFDLIAASIERFTGNSPWEMRHLLCAAFGLFGLWGTYRLGCLVGNAWVGLGAMLFLTLTGSWSGAMFTHTKDIPFAAFMTWALYYSVQALQEFPKLRLRTTLKIGAMIGCAFGLRVGAVFALFYLGVGMTLCALIYPGNFHQKWQAWIQALLRLIPTVLVAVGLAILFWPWVAQAPGNLLVAMSSFSHFSFELYTLLDGENFPIGKVPGYYLSTYLLVKTPELVLAGLIFAMITTVWTRLYTKQPKNKTLSPQFLVWFALIFPVSYTLVAAPPLYNGVRHFTFLIPIICVLSALGWYAIWQRFNRTLFAQWCMAGCMIALALLAAIPLVQLHPYGYTYYNHLAKGIEAVGDDMWETDYWSSSLLEASRLLNRYIQQTPHPERPWLVAVCAEAQQVTPYLDPNYFEVSKDWTRADFFLSATHMDCDSAMKGKVIATVKRAGTILAVVKDRRDLIGADRIPR